MNIPRTLPQDLLHQLFASLCDDICCGLLVIETLRDDSANPCGFVGRIVNRSFCELLSVSEETLLEKELPESLRLGDMPLRDMLRDAAATESRKFLKAHLPAADIPCNILIYSPLPGFQAVIIKETNWRSGKNHAPNLLCGPDSIQEQAEEILASLEDLCTVIDEDFVIQYQNGRAQKFWGDCLGLTCHYAYHHRANICQDCCATKVFRDGGIHHGDETKHSEEGATQLEVTATPLLDTTGAVRAAVMLSRDMSRQKMAERSKEHLLRELQASLAKTKRLNGLLPICSYCKKIKDDNGVWQQLESYLRSHAEVEFSHGICQECGERHHPQIFKNR